ncbi:hypothetical protein C8R45DRAFT_1087612 [Mycena sanguinolenta]|nr:hypothetical protein C8R45DRAFT_1087612 [Mycena sanguinolenta]
MDMTVHVNPLVAGRDFFRVPELSFLFVFVDWNQVLLFLALSVTAFPSLPALTADPKISIQFVPQLANLPTIQLKSKVHLSGPRLEAC